MHDIHRLIIPIFSVDAASCIDLYSASGNLFGKNIIFLLSELSDGKGASSGMRWTNGTPNGVSVANSVQEGNSVQFRNIP